MVFSSGGIAADAGDDSPLRDLARLLRAPAARVQPGQPRGPAQPPPAARHDVRRAAGLDRRRRQRRRRRRSATAARSRRFIWSASRRSTRCRGNAMTHSRRDFLVRTTCAALVAPRRAQASLQQARPHEPARHGRRAPCDYRALVCIFLDGGNDSNNMIIPTDSRTTTPVRGRAAGPRIDPRRWTRRRPRSVGDAAEPRAAAPSASTRACRSSPRSTTRASSPSSPTSARSSSR